MNYKIIRLLFDPRGANSKREFRLGITLLFLLAIYATIHLFRDLGLNAIIGQQGVRMLASYQAIKPFTIPALPVGFVLFYSSIVLAVKRVKDIGGNIWIGVLAGVIIFLFFDSVFLKLNVNALLFEDSLGITDSVKMFHILMTSLAVIIGIISMILLSVFKGNKQSEAEVKNKGELTILQFTSQAGLLCIAILIFSISTGLLSVFCEKEEFIIIISTIVILCIIIWYLTIAYQRLKNAAKKFYPFLLCFIVYIVSALFSVMIFLKTDNLVVINASLTILSVINMIFAIANASLFLLREGTEQHTKTL